MAVPEPWLASSYALLHGEDGERRRESLAAWKARHVDPEWADFSLTVCAEGCPWAEVQNALLEMAPLGASRVVVVPQAENLLEKPKELPPSVARLLADPLPDTRLLLISRKSLPAGAGKPLGVKPFSEWAKEGRVLKVGALEPKEAAAYVESEARILGLRLESGMASLLAARLGCHPGVLRRTLEVLELLAEGRPVGAAMVDAATFRLGEQSVFAWSQAWQKGQTEQALIALRQALEDDPSGAPLMLLGQARREVERLCRLVEALGAGLKSSDQLVEALDLGPRQAWLLDGYRRIAERLGAEGVGRLLRLVNEADLDLKGMAISRSPAPMTHLTVSLARVWAPTR